MHLRCRLTKNSPRRAKSTPAGVFCTLLASASPIFKSAGGRGIYCVPLLQILNVSERPRTGGVPRRIEFALRTRSQRMNTDVHSLACLRVLFTLRLVSVPPICKSAGSAAPPRMAGVLSSSEICGIHKSRR